MSSRTLTRALALLAFASQPITVSLGEVAAWMGGAALAACLFLWAIVEARDIRRAQIARDKCSKE